MPLTRRSLLRALPALLCVPAIVRASSLMKVSVPKLDLLQVRLQMPVGWDKGTIQMALDDGIVWFSLDNGPWEKAGPIADLANPQPTLFMSDAGDITAWA